jgi:hypothetical protein
MTSLLDRVRVVAHHKWSRIATPVGFWLIAGSGACSSTDTIVSVNVASDDTVGAVTGMHVTITQGSQTLTSDLVPPVMKTDAGDVIKKMFFQRIVLPDAFLTGPATVMVEADRAGGPLKVSKDFAIDYEAVVAVFIDLGVPKPTVDAGVEEDAGL